MNNMRRWRHAPCNVLLGGVETRRTNMTIDQLIEALNKIKGALQRELKHP